MLSESFRQAYLQTNYCFNGNVIHIGKPCQAVADLLKSYPNQGAVFITAYNPFGKVLTSQANHQANLDLLADLQSQSLHIIEGYGESPDGQWRENSYLAYPVTKKYAYELCIKYQQNAVVFIDSNGMSELIFAFNQEENL